MADKRNPSKEALRAKLAARSGAMTAHPDEEELVRYQEQTLAPARSAEIQEHFLVCPMCRALVLAIARTEDESGGARVLRTLRARARRLFKGLSTRRHETDTTGRDREVVSPGTSAIAWRPASVLLTTAALCSAVAIVIVAVSSKPSYAPLGHYTIDIRGSQKSWRGATQVQSEPLLFPAGSQFEVVLRPKRAVDGPLEASAFRVMEGVVEPWTVPIEVSPQGAVRISGRVGEEIALPTGDSTIIVAIGRPGAIPDGEAIAASLTETASSEGRDWAAWKVAVTIQDSVSDAQVEYSGCRATLAGPVCVPGDDRKLKLWIGGDAADEVVIAEGGRVADEIGLHEGRLLLLELDASASSLVLERRGSPWRWRLRLGTLERPAWIQKVIDAAVEQPDVARQLAEAHVAPQDSERGYALGRLGRLALRRADWDNAEHLLRDAMLAHRERGIVSEEVAEGTNLVWLLVDRGEFAQARLVLDRLPAGPDFPANIAVDLDYYRGMLAEESGDLRNALRFMSRAAQRAGRLDLSHQALYANALLARELQTIGQSIAAEPGGETAPDRFDLLVEQAMQAEPCERGQLLSMAGWIRILEYEAGRPVVPAMLQLEQAVQAFNDECAKEPAALPNALLNLAIGQEQSGRLEQARATLERYRTYEGQAAPRYDVWLLEVEARLALHDGQNAQALARYERMGQVAAHLSPESQWRAAYGRARALTALGDVPAALEAYRQAEQLLWNESLLVPMHRGRDSFVAGREQSTRAYVALLLQQDANAEALAVVRRARTRFLRSVQLDGTFSPKIGSWLDARKELETLSGDRWALSDESLAKLQAKIDSVDQGLLSLLDDLSTALAENDEPNAINLPSIPPGELLLAYYPLPDGWAGFAATSHGITARRLLSPEDVLEDADALGQRLLSPFAAEIGEADVVRLQPYGPLRSLDLHALPLDGAPLLAHKPVVYGLDLPASPDEPATSGRIALLVGDPRNDLPQSAREIDSISDLLSDGFDVKILTGPEASRDRVRQQLSAADFFHYAGHAAFGGLGGWRSALDLAPESPAAAETSFTVDDILTLPHAPAALVISGCEGSESDRTVPAESMGLAHAFLLAGSSIVIAPSRPIRDEEARELMLRLYTEWNGSASIASALQRAELSLAHDMPDSDWSTFRAIVR